MAKRRKSKGEDVSAIEMIAQMAEAWESESLQDNMTATQRRTIENLADEYVSLARSSRVDVNAGVLWSLLVSIEMHVQADKNNVLVETMKSMSITSNTADTMRMIAACLCSRLLRGDIEPLEEVAP